MKLQELTPLLRTTDLKGSIEFYTTVLGFECDGSSEEWGWASVRRDNVTIMFALPNEHEPFDGPAFTGSFYINPDDVDALWERVKDKARVCYPIDRLRLRHARVRHLRQQRLPAPVRPRDAEALQAAEGA